MATEKPHNNLYLRMNQKGFLRKMKSVLWKDMDWSPEQYLRKFVLRIYKDERDENINYIGSRCKSNQTKMSPRK